MSKSVNQASKVNQVSNGGFAVFSDENAPASKLPTASGEWKQPPTNAAIVKENTQKPGKWNNCKVKRWLFGLLFYSFWVDVRHQASWKMVRKSVQKTDLSLYRSTVSRDTCHFT